MGASTKDPNKPLRRSVRIKTNVRESEAALVDAACRRLNCRKSELVRNAVLAAARDALEGS